MKAGQFAGAALALVLAACTNDYDGLLANADPAGAGPSGATSGGPTGAGAGDPGATSTTGAGAGSSGDGGSGVGAGSGAGGAASSSGGASGTASGGASGSGGEQSGTGGSPSGSGGSGPLGCTGFAELPGYLAGSCYQYVELEASWGAAKLACNLWGGDLVVVGTPEEWTYIQSVAAIGDDYWIGLHASVVSGYAYQWVDFSAPSWSLPWNPNNGDDGFGEPNAKVSGGGFQAVIGAEQADHYLCEKAP